MKERYAKGGPVGRSDTPIRLVRDCGSGYGEPIRYDGYGAPLYQWAEGHECPDCQDAEHPCPPCLASLAETDAGLAEAEMREGK